MPIALSDPTIELQNRKRAIDTRDIYSMDEKETRERQEAARAYAGEDEKHFVDYITDCRNQSVKGHKSIRATQYNCWNVYKENEPVSYKDKEEWQARTIIPKPFQTVQYGAAAIKKAFSPNFLSIEKAKNKPAADFWQRLMEHELNNQHAKFVTRFADATIMALATGISMEMIPRWIPGKGLEFALIEPWKIHRDPDALSRDSQSGMYWIHEEWLDYFVLKKGEKNGRFFDVDRVKETESGDSDNPFLSKEAIAARKEMIWERSKYRKMILTSEFWGIILDKKGNVLLPNGTCTMAGGRIIQKPKISIYKSMRWPGISFSPLPDILKHGGRGLLEGIMTVWEAMNNMMCLHQDYMQWLVNPNTEINVDALVDATDVEQWPGKENLVKDTISGQQAIRVVQRRGRTNEVLANMQYYDQNFQRGSFVTDSVQGLPGYRKDITYREAAMNLDQALAVYGLMGENIEEGAIDIIGAAADIIESHAGYNDYTEVFTEDELNNYGIKPNINDKRGVSGIPKLDGSFHVSGIQALMKDNETLTNIKQVMIPLANDPAFGPFIKPYKILKSIETRVNLTDEDIIVDEDQAVIIDLQKQLAQAKEMDAAQKLQDLQEAMGVTDLVGKIKEIETRDIGTMAGKIKETEAPKK